MITDSKLDQARSYVAKMDAAIAGQEGHNTTFKVACKLVSFGLSQFDAWTLLLEYNQRCLPPWSERELQHKLADAFRLAVPGTSLKSLPSFYRPIQKIEPASATINYLKNFRAEEIDLWEASPIRAPDDWTKDAACLVSQLYEKNELVNIVLDYQLDTQGKARPDGVGITLSRDEMIRRLSAGEFQSAAGGWLRMNPVNGQGVADVNITSLRFALIESDALPIDLQISLFARLPLPIAVIMTSGGKSLHAWVRVDAKDADDYRNIVSRMLALLSKFGVDGKNKNPSRLSRLPGVVRSIGANENDGRQRLLYLNPDPQPQTRIL